MAVVGLVLLYPALARSRSLLAIMDIRARSVSFCNHMADSGCSQRKTKPRAPFRWFQFLFNPHDASASFIRVKHLQLLTAFSARQSVRCGARSQGAQRSRHSPAPRRSMSIASGNAVARPSRPMMTGGLPTLDAETRAGCLIPRATTISYFKD
jgi:hypothetical protein